MLLDVMRLNNLGRSAATFIVTASVGAILISGVSVFRHFQLIAETEPEVGIARHGPTASGFAPMQVVPPFPAITNAPVVKVSEVGDGIHGDELVLGVEIEGEQRAYPINMLTGPSREIINDRIGKTDFAATW